MTMRADISALFVCFLDFDRFVFQADATRAGEQGAL